MSIFDQICWWLKGTKAKDRLLNATAGETLDLLIILRRDRVAFLMQQMISPIITAEQAMISDVRERRAAILKKLVGSEILNAHTFEWLSSDEGIAQELELWSSGHHYKKAR